MLFLHPASSRLAWPLAALIALLAAWLLIGTSGSLPLVWDEGDALNRARGIEDWFHLLLTRDDREAVSPWSAEVLAEHWPYTTRREGHPTLTGILIAAGRALSPDDVSPLTAARCGAMLLFAVATGGVAFRLARDVSLGAGVVGGVALLTVPRIFAHAHFALGDGPLTSCWLLAWTCYRPREMRWYHTLGTGCFAGLAMSCKATGWLLPLPFLVVALLHGNRAAWRHGLAAGGLALFVFWLINPPLWHAPWQGMSRFLELNLHRADRPGHNISTLFLGRMYNLDHPVPWYNGLVWMLIALPLSTLLLSLLGIVAACRRRNAVGHLLLANALLLLIVRALPGVPPHDGIRLLLPAFAFLAALAGLGADGLAGWLREQGLWGGWRSVGYVALLSGLLAGSASSVVWHWPQGLSHYNLLIGGLRGAAARGMEPTYFWDGLDRPVLDWLNAHTDADEKIRFAAIPTDNLAYLQAWGRLQRQTQPEAPGSYRWYVLQHRPSGYSPIDRWLIEHETPAFRHTIRPADSGWGPWRLDVAVIDVFDEAAYQRAKRAIDE